MSISYIVLFNVLCYTKVLYLFFTTSSCICLYNANVQLGVSLLTRKLSCSWVLLPFRKKCTTAFTWSEESFPSSKEGLLFTNFQDQVWNNGFAPLIIVVWVSWEHQIHAAGKRGRHEFCFMCNLQIIFKVKLTECVMCVSCRQVEHKDDGKCKVPLFKIK